VRTTSLWIVVGLGLGAAGGVRAQDVCRPAKNSNEAKVLGIFAVPLAFAPAGAPISGSGSRVQIGIEGSYLPKVDPATAIPTTCRPDKTKPEHTDLLFAAPRPRIAIRLGAGFALEASWIPPIRLSGVKANLFGGALSYAHALDRKGTVVAIRVHGTFGVVNAPVTCDAKAIRDPTNLVCFGGRESDDSYHPNIVGTDVTVGWNLGQGKVRPYLGAGYNHLAPRFQVNFTNQDGFTDRRRVEVDLSRAVLFGGMSWRVTRLLDLSGELYSAPADAVTGRVAVRVMM
jgi:hypothetical protein